MIEENHLKKLPWKKHFTPYKKKCKVDYKLNNNQKPFQKPAKM